MEVFPHKSYKAWEIQGGLIQSIGKIYYNPSPFTKKGGK